MEIGHVENLPTELQILAFPRHLPAFAQSHIQTRIPISSNHVSRTGLAGEGMLKVVESSHRIGENAHGTVGRIPVMPGLGSSDHQTETLLVPVCRPEVAVINRNGKPLAPRATPDNSPPPIQASAPPAPSPTRLPSPHP